MNEEGAKMPTWKNSSMDTFFSGEQSTCEVRISAFEIVVSYQDNDRTLEYKGKEIAPGHFELTSAETGGKASLHRSPDNEWLEGSWLEGEREGMWRIRLGE
jgi:hypothetical protein